MSHACGFLTMKARACVLAALAAGMLFGAETPAAQFKSVNAAAAAAALERASSLAGAGEWDQASFEAKLGASYDPALADFPYIEALTSAASGKPRAETISHLENALSRGLRWRLYDRSEAVLLCARMYAETLRYADALVLLSSLGRYPSADADFIRAWCLYGQGKTDAARDVVSAALDRWPFDSRFPRIFLERSSALKADSGSLAVAHTIVSRLYVWENDDRSLLLLSVPFLSDSADRDRNIRTFRSMGASDSPSDRTGSMAARSAVYALEYGIIGEKEAVAEVFAAADLDLDSVSRLCALSVSEDARASIFARLGSFSGTAAIDENGDGIIDARIRYSSGRPDTAVFDRNQDGIEDYRVECDLGAPRTIFAGNGETEVRFDTYPSVKAVRTLTREYTMKPGALLWAPVRWLPLYTDLDAEIFYTVALTGTEPVLSERLLVRNASFYTEPDADNPSGLVRIVLASGMPASAEARENGAVYRHTTYLDGYPSVSKLDRDRDGVFETLVHYGKNASERTILVDSNGNRTPEYREAIGADGAVASEWDCDEDGFFEISWKESPNASGTLTWTHPSTGQPVVMITDKGAPRSVSYSGRTLPVLKDPSADLWWVGRLPSSARLLAEEIADFFNRGGPSVVSGIVTAGSSRAFAVRTGGILCAEPLDE